MKALYPQIHGELWIAYAMDDSKILGRDLYRVRDEIVVYLAPDVWITIPRGYLTDGASVPRLLWNIIPPWGSYGAAVVTHDILCEYLSFTVRGLPVKITREQADNVLADLMYMLEVDEDEQDLINAAVSSYRKVLRIDSPVWHKDKAILEANWVANNPI